MSHIETCFFSCTHSRASATGEVEGAEAAHPHTARIRTAVHESTDRLGITHTKHRPRVAGGGENLPLEILRSLSIWLSVLDERGVVTGMLSSRCGTISNMLKEVVLGPVLGGMYGCLASFEDSLASEYLRV